MRRKIKKMVAAFLAAACVLSSIPVNSYESLAEGIEEVTTENESSAEEASDEQGASAQTQAKETEASAPETAATEAPETAQAETKAAQTETAAAETTAPATEAAATEAAQTQTSETQSAETQTDGAQSAGTSAGTQTDGAQSGETSAEAQAGGTQSGETSAETQTDGTQSGMTSVEAQTDGASSEAQTDGAQTNGTSAAGTQEQQAEDAEASETQDEEASESSKDSKKETETEEETDAAVLEVKTETDEDNRILKVKGTANTDAEIRLYFWDYSETLPTDQDLWESVLTEKYTDIQIEDYDPNSGLKIPATLADGSAAVLEARLTETDETSADAKASYFLSFVMPEGSSIDTKLVLYLEENWEETDLVVEYTAKNTAISEEEEEICGAVSLHWDAAETESETETETETESETLIETETEIEIETDTEIGMETVETETEVAAESETETEIETETETALETETETEIETEIKTETETETEAKIETGTEIETETNEEEILLTEEAFAGMTLYSASLLGEEQAEITASGTCGTNLTWTLYSDGTLVIDGDGAMTNYSSWIYVPWYSYRSSITSVEISDGVTSIGAYAFGYCSSITEITIPDSVTAIGMYAFYECSSLTEIVIPEGVTSIGKAAFYDCSSLAEITIPEGVTSIGDYTFYKCSSLTEMTIPEGVTSIGENAFNSCISLAEIEFPDSLKSIGQRAFSGCRLLEEIILPDGMTSIGAYAFSGCSALTEIVIPSGVTSIGNGTFSSCTSLTDVELPDSVTSIGNSAFSGCTSLKEITIPNSVTSIGSNAFNGCTSLTEATIGDAVKSIGTYAFSGCISLEEITIPDSVTSIGSYAFDGCTSLTEATIGDAVKSIGTYAFSGCTSLGEITIPDSVTSIGDYAFDGCTSLKEATIGDGVTSIGSYAFNGCISLEEITIPDSVTSIGSYAFYECTSLAEATFEDPTAITSMGSSVFENCKMLGSVNTYTTLEDVLSLFENATIDTTVFANTALDRTKVSQLTVTDGNESFSVAIGGVSDVLTVSISSTQNSATMWSDAYETIPYLYTGQNATVEVSLSPQGVDLTGETLDFYVGFTGLNADMTLAVGTHNYTMSDGTEVEVTISYVGGWPDAYKISINGDNLTSDTLSFNFNTTYESPSSAGGSMYVWIEDNMDNALRVDWGTKVDEYELTKSNWNTVSFAAEDDDIYMLDLAYSFNLNRDTTASYLEVGKDYISSVDFTDILDLPEELEWRDGLIDAIKNGEWYTTLTYVDCDVYVTIGGEDYLFCSIDMPSTNVVTFQSCNMEITSDNKIALSYSYMNASATSEWTTSTAYLYFGDSVIKVTDPDAEPKSDSIDIVNNLTSTEHFHYSTEDQVDTATATKTIAWGTPEITLKKSGSNSYLGDSGTYTITAKNPSAFSYHELQYLYDVPSRYLYIKADDMQDMFDDDSDDHTLTIQMTNATLTAPNSKTVTNMSGNNSVTLDQQNVQAAGTDYSGLEKTDSSLITSSATITITWVDDNSDLLVMTVSDGGSETSYTIGSGGNYDSISDALSAIGYIVTYAVQYSMTWDLGDDYVLRGGTTLTKSYVLTAKDTFMLLTGDQYWYIKDNSTYTYGGNYNYIYAKDENNTQITYAYTPSTMRLYRDFVLDKDDTDVKRYSSDSSSYESVDDDTIEYGDIISYQTKVTHLGSASYDGLPLVDKMSGGQILLIPVSANATNTSLPTQSLETVTVDGTDYYILNQAGTYSNVVVDSTGRIADTVTVTVNGDGSVETMIYWYLSISGSQTLTFDYMSIVRPVNGDLDESYSYTLSNEAWLNDHETHRLYDAAFKDGAILKVSKDIVTSGADNNDPSDDELESRTTLSEGETVTYRFTLNATGPVTLTGSDIYDVLPETVSGNAWTASDITVRLVTDDDDVTPDTLSAWASGWYVTGENPDEATLGASDPDTQQYLRWNTGLSIAYEGMLYVYVTLTFPDGSDWLEYVEAYADLENTLHVLQLYDTVYHDMPIKSSVYLQKGVASIKELYSSSPRTSFSSGKYNGLYYYTIDGALSSWSLGSNLQYLNRSYYNESLVTYYTVLYNDGRTNLYLSDLYDVLPAGFRYVAYSYIYTSSSYTSLTKYLTSGLELYGSDEMAIEDVVYKTFDIESSYDETNNIVTFSLSGGNLSQNGDEYYLAPGEAIAFQYCAIPQYSADTEDVSTNTITMQFDDNGAGVDVANVHSVYKTSAEQNEGTCSVEGTSYIENLGLSGDSDIWLVSAVTVYRDSIVPNIVKSTDQVTATDTEDIDWSVTVTNSGNATMDGYTLIDVMQSPYSFSGTVSYTVKAKTNGGTGTSTTTYTLFTIKDATDTELTLNALVPGTRTNSEHKDFTLQLNGASSTIELYQSSGTIPITVRW